MSPQDSLRHQLQKLTEDPSNTNNLLNSTDPDQSPPPYSFSTVNIPYTQSGPTLSRERMAELMSDIIYTDEPNPLTITVDASINIIGNNNSLALTSQPTASGSTPASASSSASGSTSTSTQPSEESIARESRKKDREARAAKLASVILKALQQADGLTDETGRKRTVSVLLKCGIRVEGCNNEIVADEDVNKLISTCSLKVSSAGKKRGSSESPTIPPPPPKRNCRIL